ncbi:MAG: 7-carboxy-7-deazaguanine synthase QueE [Sediminibacterium sp.]|jgi:7-carboxy-7-deazaguanine synthase
MSVSTETISTDSTSLPIMETFYSLQGEGFHQGKAAFFIRLAGCDVGCFWCDVKESWDASLHPRRTIESLTEEAIQHPAKTIIITGGEPLLHQLDELTQSLKKAGKTVHLETSGSSPLSGHFDWICLSPKKFKAPLPEVISKADELKIIVYNKHDLTWALEWEQQVNSSCQLYLQPEWDQRDKILPEIITFILQNPRWQLSMQVHKFASIP